MRSPYHISKRETHHGKRASDRPSHSCWTVCFPEIGAEQWRSNRTWNNSQYENSHHNSPRRQTRMSSIWWRKLYWHWNIFIRETYDRCSAMWAETKWGSQQTCDKQREECAQIEIIVAHLSGVFRNIKANQTESNNNHSIDMDVYML